jgi:hypothetical protein
MVEIPTTSISLDAGSVKYLNLNFMITLQVNDIRQLLTRATGKEEIEICEDALRVFIAMLGTDKIYADELDKLNREYSIKNYSSVEEEVKIKKTYSIRHFAIIMQLAGRKGYNIIREGEIVFSSDNPNYPQMM